MTDRVIRPPDAGTAPDAIAELEADLAHGAASTSSTGAATDPGWTRRQRVVLAAIGLVIFAVYTTYAWARHAKYETTGYDLGIFDQVVRAYAHFHAPTSPLKGIGYNILGDHFHPILVLFAPLYWIRDDPRMLLAAQAALFAVSIIPVAAFVRRRFGAVAALVTAVTYGFSWPLERAVQFDVHEIAFAVPLIAWMIDAMDRRAYRTVALCCGLLLLVREDMGALVLLVGLLVALRPPAPARGGRHPRLLGVALMVVGAVAYWIATAVIIPAMGPQGFTYWTFTALGSDPGSAVRFALSHPLRVVHLFLTPRVKLATLVATFLPAGFLTLLSPYVLLTLPFLAERMLNDRPLLWGTNFHYTSVIAPVLVMGAADTVDRLVRWFPRVLRTRRVLRGHLPLGLVAAWVVWSVGCVTYGLAVDSPDYPMRGLTSRVWHDDERWHDVHEILPMIPAGECVESDNQIAPQLTPRDYVTRVTYSRGLATWIVIDISQRVTGWQAPEPADALAISELHGYRPVAWRGVVVLLHKDQPVAPVCRGLY